MNNKSYTKRQDKISGNSSVFSFLFFGFLLLAIMIILLSMVFYRPDSRPVEPPPLEAQAGDATSAVEEVALVFEDESEESASLADPQKVPPEPPSSSVPSTGPASAQENGPNIELVDEGVLMPVKMRGSRWSRNFDSLGDAPVDMFRVTYLDTDDVTTPVAMEYTKSVRVDFSEKNRYGIRADRFGASWIGHLQFDRRIRRTIRIMVNYGEARVFIAGREVFRGRNSGEFDYLFPAGLTTVEIDYINRWNTADFQVSF